MRCCSSPASPPRCSSRARPGEAVARGELQAIWPLLGALDRLDRYQKDARDIHRDNEEIREKLYAKITRLAEVDDRKYGPRPEPEPDEWEPSPPPPPPPLLPLQDARGFTMQST